MEPRQRSTTAPSTRSVLMPPRWDASRAKVQLRLGGERTRALQFKLEATQKADRRALALLVERGKVESARLRAEALITTDVYIELLELLELYIGTLTNRFALLEHYLAPAGPSFTSRSPDPTASPPEHLAPALASILFAAAHTEVKELSTLRDDLLNYLPRAWAAAAIAGDAGTVPRRVLGKVPTAPPDPGLVEAYMVEITAAYHVSYSPAPLMGLTQPQDAPPDPRPGPRLGPGPDPVLPPDYGDIATTSAVVPSHDNDEEKAGTSGAPHSTARAPTPPTTKAKTGETDWFAELERRFHDLKQR